MFESFILNYTGGPFFIKFVKYPFYATAAHLQ